MPLFPLQVVLLPRTALPLHIFEDRYKEMIGEVLRADSQFGVVLAREKGIVNTGCAAAVEKVLKRYPDGRLDILTVGRRRFEILLLNEEKSFLRGAVQFFDDEEPAPHPGEPQQKVLEAARQLCDIEEVEVPEGLAPEDPQFSFQVTQLVDDVNFRLAMLRLRSEAERIGKLAAFLEQYVPRQRLIAGVRKVAPRNGHGHIPLKLSDLS